jgi:hypothetical protein
MQRAGDSEWKTIEARSGQALRLLLDSALRLRSESLRTGSATAGAHKLKCGVVNFQLRIRKLILKNQSTISPALSRCGAV